MNIHNKFIVAYDTLIYLVFKGVSIEFTLLILKYKYWLIVVNPHFLD